MAVQVRYYTRSGNTKKLADAVAEAVKVQGEEVSVPLTEKADILFLGCSYYAFDMDPEVKAFLHDNAGKIGKLVVFGTSAMLKSMRKPMLKVAAEEGIRLADEEFHCYGSFGPMHKGRPNEEDCRNVQKFAKKVAGIS